jgi:hypothetical protein
MCSAKLRFRDPDESERLGEDRFLFLWLSAVHYQTAERVFSGTFFEVPHGLQRWHQVGQSLGFDPEEIFDWMVLRQGHLPTRLHAAGNPRETSRGRARLV